MPQATPIASLRRPTAAPGDFCYISQTDWNNLITTAQSGNVNLAKKAKNKLQKLHVAARMMGNECRPASRACDYCAQRTVPCRIWVNHTVGQMCARCRWRNKSCNAEDEAEDEGEIDNDNDEGTVHGGDDDGMVVDEDDDAEFSDAEMEYISTIGTRGEPSPEKEEYVDMELRRKNGNFNREFGAILAASLERVEDLANGTLTRVVALEEEVESLNDEVSRLREENMKILNDNQSMKEDLSKLREFVSGSGA
ncbi:hypothetical protein BDV97DRAFT_366673 [Delphinella strobiligena]|nr:hypothetical protein BDV97DRAFT_366673 [Delphinella strobiligena]